MSAARKSHHLQLVSPPTIEGKLPPHDLEAEAATISATILKPAAAAAALRMLKPAHFFSGANRLVWKAIVELSDAGSALDAVIVAAWLRERELLPAVGGIAYIAQLVDATPAIAHVDAHALIVLRKSQLRAAIAEMQCATAEGYGDHGDDAEFLLTIPGRIERAGASGLSLAGDYTIAQAAKQLRAKLEETRRLAGLGARPGLDTRIPALQELTGGFHRREVVMLSAPTKGWKTTVALALALNVAMGCERYVDEYGHEQQRPQGVAIFELEMTAEELAMLASCAISGAPRERFRQGSATPADFDRLLAGSHMFDKLPIRIDERRDLSISNLRGAVREKRERLFEEFKAPLRLVVIDTIQIFALGAGQHDPDNEQAIVDGAGRFIRALSLEREFEGVSWLVLSQVNADGKMRGSRALEHHCSSWWSLRVMEDKGAMSRPNVKIAQIIAKLQRAGRMGDDAIAAAWINVETGRVSGE